MFKALLSVEIIATRGQIDAENIGFYAIAYEHQGDVIISYRGTDDGLLSKDFLHGFGVGTGTANAEQGIMALNFYRAAPCLH